MCESNRQSVNVQTEIQNLNRTWKSKTRRMERRDDGGCEREGRTPSVAKGAPGGPRRNGFGSLGKWRSLNPWPWPRPSPLHFGLSSFCDCSSLFSFLRNSWSSSPATSTARGGRDRRLFTAPVDSHRTGS